MAAIKVVEVTAFEVKIPLRKSIRHASHTRSDTDNVVVHCVLSDGSEGFGEGVPREYVTGETVDSALSLLRQSALTSQFEVCHSFTEAVAMAERLKLSPVPGDLRNCQSNAARCALELAILDAYGRSFGAKLSNITRILAPDIYEQRPWVQYSGAITSAAGFKVRLAAWKMKVFGFAQIKLKVGIAGQNDASRLRIIRNRVGTDKDIRVDVNEAWAPTEVIDRLHELKPFAISAVEQPVPHKDVKVLAEVRRHSQIPIMLDESLCSPVDAETAISEGTCDLFNLRLSKCGGFIPTLRLAQLARRNGLSYQLGCQIGETALLSAAGRHFATSVAGIRYVEGSYDRHLVKEALGATDITFKWRGWAPALTGPGLGVDIDRQALERVTSRKEPLVG